MEERSVFVPRRRSSKLLERLLISSVASVVVIRLYLGATGYPQVGGGGLHISHMLWGGLGMLIALVLSLIFTGKRVQAVVALLGGIGFGTFIDELGKFITSDNDYFFRPTTALIYAIFLILLLVFRLLRRSPMSERERLADALSILVEKPLRSLGEQDKEEILSLLRADDSRESHVKLLIDAVERMPTASDPPLSRWKKMGQAIRNSWQRFVDSPYFVPFVVVFFIGYALLFTISAASGMANLAMDNVVTSVVKIGWFTSSGISCIMIVMGILSLWKSQLASYLWFRRSIFVSIFLTQIFLLYIQTTGAIDELLVNLVLLAILDSLIGSHRLSLRQGVLAQPAVG